ncbi:MULTISPECIES: VanZ family protein [unclassified Curtobacterium]|uniref:VanZ family protein n=1 Tax=unclassified Curtobacterium TaxID=257496 RepID=UPI001047C553|nr:MULTISPECIES: VanZ family protein [unclassified Curtobacterium]TCL75391.1 VanZ like protein [Curtobacterium sp. PhB128]TCL92133.1 VanZ like protein [Curtobacterium sp. PhB138]
MLSTLLIEVPWLAFGVLIAVIVVAPVVGVWLARLPRLTAVLFGLAVVVTLALTLSPDGAPRSDVTCNVGLPYLAPTAVESTANVLLFVPIAFLAGVRWRRPVRAAVGASAFSVLIEVVQAVVPVIGRACDTSDWITNTIGAVVGGALAAAVVLWARRRVARVS